MSAHAQEMNEDAPAVNVSGPEVLTTSRLAKMTGKRPAIVADTPEPEEERIFKTECEEIIIPEEAEE